MGIRGRSSRILAWVNFVSATGAINKQENVASVTRNAVGDYTINFSNPLPHANYVIHGTGSGQVVVAVHTTLPTMAACRVVCFISTTGVYIDPVFIGISIVGN